MELWQIIKETYPELSNDDFLETIILRDDSDGQGAYIANWDYSKPIPEGLTLGKPSA